MGLPEFFSCTGTGTGASESTGASTGTKRLTSADLSSALQQVASGSSAAATVSVDADADTDTDVQLLATSTTTGPATDAEGQWGPQVYCPVPFPLPPVPYRPGKDSPWTWDEPHWRLDRFGHKAPTQATMYNMNDEAAWS